MNRFAALNPSPTVWGENFSLQDKAEAHTLPTETNGGDGNSCGSWPGSSRESELKCICSFVN